MRFRGAVLFLVAGVLGSIASPSVDAQDGNQAKLKQAHALYEQGRVQEGLTLLNEILASNPSSDEAWRLRETLAYDQWVDMMIRGGQHNAVVTALFDRAMPEKKARSADPEAIRAKLGLLFGADHAARRRARLELFAEHGEYAVPALIGGLSNPSDDVRAATIWELTQLGAQAVLPLIEVLRSDDAMQAANAARALGNIRDPRAVPYLQACAQGPFGRSDMLRKAAGDALARMDAGPFGAGGPVRGLMTLDEAFSRASTASTLPSTPVRGLVALAEAFYHRIDDAVRNWDDSWVVWHWMDGGLSALEVPKEIYHLKLAETAAHDALTLDPTCIDAHVLLASVNIALSLGATQVVGDDDAAKALGSALGYASVLTNEAGRDVLMGALARSLAEGRAEVATGAIDYLTPMLTDSDFATPGPLTAALADPMKAARYAAAFAACSVAPAGPFPNCDRVVPNLAQALGEDSTRQVLVVDDNPATRNQLVADLGARGWFAVSAETGPSGVVRLREYPVEDMVIIRASLGSMSPADFIAYIRRDSAMEKVIVVLLCEAAERAACEATFGSAVAGIITAPLVADAYEPALRALLGEPADPARVAARATAARAATCLAHMSPAGGPMASAGACEALAACLTKDDAIRVPAMQALGRIGNPATLAGLRAVLADASASEAARGEAAVAIGRVCAASRALPPEVVNDFVGILGSDAPASLHFMVGRAVGIAPFSPEQRSLLLRSQRVRVAIDLMK